MLAVARAALAAERRGLAATGRGTARSRSTRGGPLARARAPATPPRSRGSLENAPIGSSLLEASGDPYTEYARISSHTGIPTVLGWANHEGLWRGERQPEIEERLAGIKALLHGARIPGWPWTTIHKYGVTHVVVGDMERRTYPDADAVARFPFLEPVLDRGHDDLRRRAPAK